MNIYVFLIFNIIRRLVFKIRYGRRFKSSWIERLSPSASIKLFGKGKVSLGYNVNLDSYVDVLAHGNGEIMIGDRVYMNRYCMISCHDRVVIGDNCMFGPSVKIFDNNHKFAKDMGVFPEVKSGKIIVGNNCWIASNVVLLKGTKIGNNCIIGAGCTINSEIPDNSIVRLKQDLIIEQIK